MSGVEANLESKVRKYALKNGWLVYKQTGHPGIPDRQFLRAGVWVLIEFKSKIGKTSKIQDYTIKELKEHGANVFVVNNYDDAVRILDEH